MSSISHEGPTTMSSHMKGLLQCPVYIMNGLLQCPLHHMKGLLQCPVHHMKGLFFLQLFFHLFEIKNSQDFILDQ
jgi:hypothetical protein